MSENVAVASDDQAWGEIEEFVANIAQLSQSQTSTAEFLQQVLGQTIEFLTAVGGAVWLQDQPGQFTLQCEANIQLLSKDSDSEIAAAHQQFLHHVIRSVEPQSLLPDRSSMLNRSPYAWLAAPFSADGQVAGVLEILQDPHLNPALQMGQMRLLRMVCELISDFLQLLQVQELRTREQHWQRYEQLVKLTQAADSLQEVAYHLVNEGRNLIGCDRLSLLVARGKQLQVVATSGVDTIERRANSVRTMEQLARTVLRTDRPLHYRGEANALPPQLEGPLNEYLEATQACHCDVLPLWVPHSEETTESPEQIGALVVDQFAATSDDMDPQGLRQVAELAAPSLTRARQYGTWPVPTLVRLRQRAFAGHVMRKRLLIAAGCIAIAVAALALIPVQHQVKAAGELRPSIQREIYAPLDGEVVEVKSRHDEDVLQDQVLLVLRSPQLELELLRLQGEFQTTEKRLFAVRSSRVQSTDSNRPNDSLAGQLAAEEQELRQHRDSLQEQIDLLRQQREQLSIRSPINGRVLTWDAAELLEARPVQRGQLLMTTANISGPWLLELSIPESRIGYLLAAQARQNTPLQVSFTLTTDLSQRYQGEIQEIAARAEVKQAELTTVAALASVTQGPVEQLRPGTTVYAKVDCGRRSLGFVWFHEIYQKVKGWLLF